MMILPTATKSAETVRTLLEDQTDEKTARIVVLNCYKTSKSEIRDLICSTANCF